MEKSLGRERVTPRKGVQWSERKRKGKNPYVLLRETEWRDERIAKEAVREG